MDLQDVHHLFNCTAHPTALTHGNLWNRPVRQDDTRTELSRPGEPRITTMMDEKGILQQHGEVMYFGVEFLL